MKHIPVLLNEVIEALKLASGKFIIDGTVSGGGHSSLILEKMGDDGTLLGVDWDKDILSRTKKAIEEKFKDTNLKIILQHGSYTEIPEIMKREGLGKADGLLLDLGFSSEQLEAKRGFSFNGEDRRIEPLDMRYDKSGDEPTVAEVINSYKEEELADIFWKYGEERFSRQVASGIVKARKQKRIISVGELVDAIKGSVPKFFKKGEGDVVMRVFQALRIYINREFENIESILDKLPEIIKPNGIVAIITFHSLEDRIVKNKFKELEAGGRAKILNKKPIIPSREEIDMNIRSRSAKLRTIQII